MAGLAGATALLRSSVPRGADARPAPDGADLARQVRDALRHLYDPVYLQTHSLTRLVRSGDPWGPRPSRGSAATDLGRGGNGVSGAPGARPGPPPGATEGAALRRCLLETIEALQPPSEAGPGSGRGGAGEGPALRGAWRRYRLLVLRYVESLDVLDVCARLAISRREYERQHRLGLDAILSLLSQRWEVRAGPSPAPRGWSLPPPAPAALPGGGRRRPPRPLTSLIGREEEIAAVTRLLRRACLLALTGPAGVGKTRLSLEVATRLGEDYADGVVIVPLAGVAEPGQVPAAVARAVGVRETGGASLTSSLGEALRSMRLLLILDNFEHLAGAAPVVLDLLAAGPGLTVLVTSRAALGVSGEQEFPVPPLAVPPAVLAPSGPAAVRQMQTAEAVRLFVARARAVSPSFALSPEMAPAVAELCRRLDGLPLAIELAAARVRLFSPPALLARIEATAGALPLLAGGPSDAPARHQTLRAAIAWSYDLLTPQEQTLLRRLSVFAGGFGLSAAEAVGGNGIEGEGGAVVEALEGLVTKSLLRRDDREGAPRQGAPAGTGWLPPGWSAPAEDPPAPRFQMLETVR
ncbi:MAG TPA: AAA family ATPase, partial [Chloroflexota bacterium]|nr:AAA family ATPase [Chloroflexota bacterium]